ncbi:hypothetical protein ACFSYC_19400 [Mucilaginibacter antarcticus]|uniref:Uncharacterized protein n=2 Tax=Mucilaginibacter antarcticus TaxID=1855725 RepID=A0ABW5XV83_9SPHI
MKSLALFMTVCILFLSSVGGMVAPVAKAAVKEDCCQKMADKTACHQKNTDEPKDGCDKPGCNMMLLCSTCGFLTVEPVQLPVAFAHYQVKPLPLYIIGALSAYAPANWKPPKAC